MKFKVHFHGTGLPLQGIEHIKRAAAIIENESIEFNLVKGVSYEELKKRIAEADVCLGIFGTSDKAKRVIPNKLFECVAMKKPVITADTPAIRELFDDGDLLLIEAGNARQIADAVLKLKHDENLRLQLVENAYKKFISACTPKILGKQLQDILNERL